MTARCIMGTMTTENHIALLRGINVGGKHRLPMAQLTKFFGQAGATQVQTYIQSGNVVFASTPADAPQVVAAVAQLIERQCGFSAPIVLRGAGQWRQLIANNPFLAQEADPEILHVAVLADPPPPERVARLDPRRGVPDQFVVVGADVYLCLPNGVARTKLTNAWLDSTLRTVSTVRNWRTVLALGQLLN